MLPSHPDAEGELVLAALGGAKAACVELAEAWGRHCDDLEVLALGPRSAADKVAVTWDDVDRTRAERPSGWVGYAPMSRRAASALPRTGSGSGVPVGRGPGWRPLPGGGPMRPGPLNPERQQMQEELERMRARRIEMLSLLALGPALQMRLSGTVAAAWSDGGTRAAELGAQRPALAAALTGRLAPAAQAWLGLDPERVRVTVHEGDGWGTLEVTGDGAGRYLRASLPVSWLASVWACGLAVAGGHLVVAVEHAGWPAATVLALPAPGAAPVRLGVRARDDSDADTRWEVAGTGST
jgi:hypothetical protein